MEFFDVYPLNKVTQLRGKRDHVGIFINALKDILNS